MVLFRKKTFFCAILAFAVISGLAMAGMIPGSQVDAQEEEQVQIGAVVPGCQLSVIAKPEKRWPRIGNWDTFLTVRIYNSSNGFVGQYTDLSNASEGRSTVNICQLLGFTPPPGNYRFFIRGFSHLYRDFGLVSAFGGQITELDFSTDGRILYAGETSNVFDNKINSLDISTQINALFSQNDPKNDFNQDGEVNSLEIANTIDNFYMLGDFPP